MSQNKGISSSIIWDGKIDYEKKNKVQRIKEKFIDLFGPISSSDIDLILKVLHKYEENTLDLMSKYEVNKPIQSRIIFESDSDSANSSSDYRHNKSRENGLKTNHSKSNNKSKRKSKSDKTSKQTCVRKESDISVSKSSHSKKSKLDENVKFCIRYKTKTDCNHQALTKNILVTKPDTNLHTGNENMSVIIKHVKTEPLDSDNSCQNKMIDGLKDQYHDPNKVPIKKEPLIEELKSQIQNRNTDTNNVNTLSQPMANDNVNSIQIKKENQEQNTDKLTFNVTDQHFELLMLNDANVSATTNNTDSVLQSNNNNESINLNYYDTDNRYRVAVTIPHVNRNNNHNNDNITSKENNMPNIVISDVCAIKSGQASNVPEDNSLLNEVLKNIIFVMYHFQKYVDISQKVENNRSHNLLKEKARKIFIGCHSFAYKKCYLSIESEILPYDYSNVEYLGILINKAKDLAKFMKHPLPFDDVTFLRIFCNFIELTLAEKNINKVHNEYVNNIQNKGIDLTVINSSIEKRFSNVWCQGYNSNNDNLNTHITNNPKELSSANEYNYNKRSKDSTGTSNQQVKTSVSNIKNPAIKLRQYLRKYTTSNEKNSKLESILPDKIQIHKNSSVISSMQVPVQNMTTYSKQLSSTVISQNDGTNVSQMPSMPLRTEATPKHNVCINAQERSSIALPLQTEMAPNFDGTSLQKSSVPEAMTTTHPHLATSLQQRSSTSLPVYPEMSQILDNRQWKSQVQQHGMVFPPASQKCNGRLTQRSLPTKSVPPQNVSINSYHTRLPVQALMPENVNRTSDQNANVGWPVQQVPNQNYNPGWISGSSLPMQSAMAHRATPYVQQRSVPYNNAHYDSMQYQTLMTQGSSSIAPTASANTPISQPDSFSIDYSELESLLNDPFVRCQPSNENNVQEQPPNYALHEACNQNNVAPNFAPEQIRSSVSRDSGFMSPSWNEQPMCGADGVLNQQPYLQPFITRVTSLNPNVQYNNEFRPCVVCKKNTVLRCSGCLSVYLCSNKCQHQAWATHSKVCRQ